MCFLGAKDLGVFLSSGNRLSRQLASRARASVRRLASGHCIPCLLLSFARQPPTSPSGSPASQTLKSLRGRMFSFQSRGLCAMHSLMKLQEAYATSEGCTLAWDHDYSNTLFIRKETVALSESLFSQASVFPPHRPLQDSSGNCCIPTS